MVSILIPCRPKNYIIKYVALLSFKQGFLQWFKIKTFFVMWRMFYKSKEPFSTLKNKGSKRGFLQEKPFLVSKETFSEQFKNIYIFNKYK